MKYIKKLSAVGVITALMITLIGCGDDSSTTTYEPIDDSNDTVYHIAMVADDTTSYYSAIDLGFRDALSDLFGEEHLEITDSVTTDTQLLFANGEDSLTTYAESESELPIVATAVMDYQSTLHLPVNGEDSWDKTTGTNVTGIDATPTLANQVSLLIETTDPLTSVGLLYTASDENALYQLLTIEKYLDQAGIPWKEYALPLSSEIAEEAESNETESEETTDTEDGAETNIEAAADTDTTDSSTATAILPSSIVAPSLTEGSGYDVEVFGESDLSGLISPSSVHSAATSSYWTSSLSAANADSEEPAANDLEGILTYAANECSAFFITTNSFLAEDIETIVSIATDNGVTTVSGDTTIGAYTLTCAYQDSYAQGYAAGKLAYRILVDGENPGEIEIAKASAETVKLYNGDLAETFGLEFPKSFSKFTDFFETYEIGSSTERITSAEE